MQKDVANIFSKSFIYYDQQNGNRATIYFRMTLLKGGAKQRTHRARFHGWLINRCLNCNIPDRARATQINRAQYYRAAYVYFAIRNIFQKVSPRLFCFFLLNSSIYGCILRIKPKKSRARCLSFSFLIYCRLIVDLCRIAGQGFPLSDIRNVPCRHNGSSRPFDSVKGEEKVVEASTCCSLMIGILLPMTSKSSFFGKDFCRSFLNAYKMLRCDWAIWLGENLKDTGQDR